MDTDGRTVIVTGGASGIGYVVAAMFAREGADVVIGDVDGEGGEKAARRLSRGGGTVRFVHTDVSVADQCRNLMELTAEEFGRIDVVVNNAGLQHVAPIQEFPEDKWDLLLNVMLKGTFLCTKYAFPHMIKRRWGRIINISSIHGLVGVEYKAAYVAAKHGIIGLTKVTAIEGAKHNITANAICPTFVRTPLVERQIDAQAEAHGIPREEVLEKVILKEAPMGRMLEPEEVAELCLYLASESARNMTGAAIPLDEGWTAM